MQSGLVEAGVVVDAETEVLVLVDDELMLEDVVLVLENVVLVLREITLVPEDVAVVLVAAALVVGVVVDSEVSGVFEERAMKRAEAEISRATNTAVTICAFDIPRPTVVTLGVPLVLGYIACEHGFVPNSHEHCSRVSRPD